MSDQPAIVHHFPSVAGKNLEGRAFHLPADFEGELNLVFVAYERRQQDDVDSWAPFVNGVKARYPHVRVYEVPTLGSGYSLIRGFIDGGMRAGIPDAATRASTITLYINKRPYDAARGVTSEAQITVLLVRPSGELLWRTTGRYDPAHPPAINQILEK